jgi:hypothetical protein
MAEKHGVDPDIFVRLINQESGFNPRARSGSGAIGLGQLMPATAKGLGVKDPTDPVQNLDGAAKYLGNLLSNYKGDYMATLANYNGGPGAVPYLRKTGYAVEPNKPSNAWGNQTARYVRNILGEGPTKAGTLTESFQVPDVKIPAIKAINTPKIAIGDESLEAKAARLNAGQGWYDPKTIKALDTLGAYNPDTSIPNYAPTPIKTKTEFKPSAANNSIEGLLSTWQGRVDAEKNAPPPEPIVPPSNIGDELSGGFTNALTAYNNDAAAQQFAGKPAYEIGQFAGNVLGTAGAAIGGGLLGGPPGALIGGFSAGAASGAGADLQNQRLSGQPLNIGSAATAGLVGGGLNLLPVVGKGLKPLTRIAANTALQGGAAAAGSVAQQAGEQGTLTPNIDIGRTATMAGIGAAAGSFAGAIEGRALKPAPARPQVPRIAPLQQGQGSPSGRVTVQTPSIFETPAIKPLPAVGAELPETLAPAVIPEQQLFALPEKPTVKPIEYAAPEGSTAPKVDAIDDVLYRVAEDPTDVDALAKAREALPGYGDENIRAISTQVKKTVDDAIQTGAPAPRGVTQALVDPPKTGEAVQGMGQRTMTQAEIASKTRKLSGSIDDMINQGTEGSIVKNKADYDALKKRKADMPTMAQNKLGALDDITPEYMAQRGPELVATLDTMPVSRLGQATKDLFAKRVTKLIDGTLDMRGMNALRNQIADMEYRIEQQNIINQLDQINPNVKAVFESNYDPKTGLGNQKALSNGKTLEQVEDLLTPEQYNLGKVLQDVASNDGRIYIEAETNMTGATSNIEERLVTPIGFRKDADGSVALQAYNPDGYLAGYYLTPKTNAKGETSVIRRIGNVVNSTGFQGEYANLYKGIRQFSAQDILKRAPRQDGLLTSEGVALLKKAKEVFEGVDLTAINPKLGAVVNDMMSNPKAATVANIRKLEELMKTDPKVLKTLCNLLEKV